MIKKLAILLVAAIFGISAANAQLPTGGWTLHPSFGGVSSIAETRNFVYYLSGTSLFSVDKSTSELRSLNVANGLNGGKIVDIFPHPKGRYLMVVYSDCNIDRLNDDGSIVNISDIADALLPGTPEINHIGFGPNRIYIAASFGLVTIDEAKNETRSTMFTPLPVKNVFGLGDNVVINYDSKFKTVKASKPIVSLDQFEEFDHAGGFDVNKHPVVIGDSRVLFTHNGKPVLASIDFDTKHLVYSMINETGFTKIAPVGTDGGMVGNNNKFYRYDTEVHPNTPYSFATPAALKDHQVSAFDGLDELWGGDANGIAQFDISNPASPIQKGEKFGATSFATPECNMIRVMPSGDLYFINRGDKANLLYGEFPATTVFTPTLLRDKTFYNQKPAYYINSANAQYTNSKYAANLVQDPNDPSVYFVAVSDVGIMRFKDCVPTHSLHKNNSPIGAGQGEPRPSFLDIMDGVLYGSWEPMVSTNLHNSFFAIPLTAFNKETVEPSDIRLLDIPDLYRVSVGTCLQKSKMVAVSHTYWTQQMYLIRPGADGSLSLDNTVKIQSYIDQDNKLCSYNHISAMAEDKLGRLWVGTNNGVFEITDPTKVTTDVAVINHIKVPREDGTGLADYLLEAQEVTAIAVDAANTKWISTTSSGVYHVSADGDRILEHFTSSNSILPSNKVWGIACDPNSSSVYIATESGVLEYNSTSAPAKDNLDEVVAYPNPVRPDYTGWITINGLMDNTLVKIADAAGNVFFNGRSEGGMLIWDGCGPNGERVRTGVYYVFASAGTDGQTGDSCVTKIMVIN